MNIIEEGRKLAGDLLDFCGEKTLDEVLVGGTLFLVSIMRTKELSVERQCALVTELNAWFEKKEQELKLQLKNPGAIQ